MVEQDVEMTDTDLEKSLSPQKQRVKTSRLPNIEESQEPPKSLAPPGKPKVRAVEKKVDNEDSDVINTASDIPKITKKSEDRHKRRNGHPAKAEPVVMKDTT